MARGIPSHFDNDYKNDDMEEETAATSTLQDQIKLAMGKAKSQMSFEPNTSQQEAVVWALSRTLGLIRGPPGVYLMICVCSDPDIMCMNMMQMMTKVSLPFVPPLINNRNWEDSNRCIDNINSIENETQRSIEVISRGRGNSVR